MVETRVRAIIHAFLLLFFIFWLRKRVYEQLYTRFVCFFFSFYILASETRVRAIVRAFLLLFLFSGSGNACTIARTCFSYFFFFFFFLVSYVFFYFFLSSEHVYNCLYTCFL